MAEPFIIALHGAPASGKTTVARLLCQLMPSKIPGLFLDGGSSPELASALLGQDGPFSSLFQVCEPLLTRAGVLDEDGEEMDWRVADAVMAIGDMLDVMVLGKLPDPFMVEASGVMMYGLKRLLGQYGWVVIDNPSPKCLEWIRGVYPVQGVWVLSGDEKVEELDAQYESLAMQYRRGRFVALLNGADHSTSDQWVRQAQGEHQLKCMGRLPSIQSNEPDPLGVLLPALESSLYHLNMPFPPSA